MIFLNNSVFGTFYVIAVFPWQSYQGISISNIPIYHLSEILLFSSHEDDDSVGYVK